MSEQFSLRENDEYITLGQLLKASGLVMSGSEAKALIQNGEVCVNGETETRRGRKLRAKDRVLFDGREIEIVETGAGE